MSERPDLDAIERRLRPYAEGPLMVTSEWAPSVAESIALVEYARSLEARVARLTEALNCEHNLYRDDANADADRWEYVEREGKTWNRCRSCGLLELWEGGMFVLAALAEGPPA